MVMRRNLEPKEPIKSYKERRAQSRSNHISSTDSKGLQQIQENLKKRRMSVQQGENLFGSFCQEDLIQQPTQRYRTQSLVQQQKFEQNQSTKIIQKYGDTIDLIKQVEEQLFHSIKNVNPEELPTTKSTLVSGIKNTPIQQQKKTNIVTKLSFTNMKNPQKITSDSNNLITPRKTTRQVVNKTNATIPTKSDRKTVQVKLQKKIESKVSKLDQAKFIKKLQGIQEQLSKLGFEKGAEAKWHLKNILQLLKQ